MKEQILDMFSSKEDADDWPCWVHNTPTHPQKARSLLHSLFYNRDLGFFGRGML